MIPDISLEAVIELLVMILALTGLGAEAPEYPEHGTVTEVVDGDTIKIENSYETYTIRFLGVDTPESNGAVHPSEFRNTSESCLRTYADNSKAYTQQELLGKNVTLNYDDVSGKTGSFGRLLAEVEYDGGNINENLLELGYARFYEDERYLDNRKERYKSLEEQAVEKEKGVWADCQ
jgi:micrococcal nuclease